MDAGPVGDRHQDDRPEVRLRYAFAVAQDADECVGHLGGGGVVGVDELSQQVLQVREVALVVGEDHGAHAGLRAGEPARGWGWFDGLFDQPFDALGQCPVGAAVAHQIQPNAPALGGPFDGEQFLLDVHELVHW